MSDNRTVVVGIAGWKNSGKTTLAERLIAEFMQRGLRVASVKHAHHAFEIDDPKTDSGRHRRAGASQVAIVSSRRWALMTELGSEPEPSLEQVLAQFAPCDLVIVEGYKRASIPKIEVRRRASLDRTRLAPRDAHIIAIASDAPDVEDDPLPKFHLDDVSALADYLQRTLLRR